MVDYVVDYLENIWDWKLFFNVFFGYLKELILDKVLDEVE